MKKVLSAILAATMLLALCVALVVPASAIDGAWIVYSKADRYLPDYEGDIMSIAGYEYTAEGLRIIGADWRDFTPGVGIQTKEKVDIKDGVYMEVRIDEFNYEADHWFNFNIWSKEMIKPGTTDPEKWGFGFQDLIRSNAQHNSWRIEWKTGGTFQNQGATALPLENVPGNDTGKVTLTFEVIWSGSSYSVKINGVAAPEAVVKYLNETYSKDSEAYIGFNFQNGTKGGKCACTVLKFGTDKENATIPMGDDSRAPQNFYVDIAELASADTVPAGQPAIFMNANRINSDSKKVPDPGQANVTVNEDYSVHVVATSSTPYLGFSVKNSVSYDVDDFPVAMLMVKDLCTCGEDGCYALESVNMYLMAGETAAASAACKINELDMCYDPAMIDGHNYLYFFYDSTDAPFETSGRINGARFDFTAVDVNTAGKNAFDVCFAAFFRNTDEAIAYAESYLTALGWEKETEPVTTEAPTEVTTEAPAVDTTEAPAVDTTEAPTVETTEAPAVDTPIEGTDAPATGDKEPAKSGCGSVVGFGTVAIVALVAACGIVSFKKKD